MSTGFDTLNLLPRFCQLAFNRNLLTQITDSFLFCCAVAAVFIGTFAVTPSATAGTLDDVRSRDKLICGVSEGLPGFSEKDDWASGVASTLIFARLLPLPCSATPQKSSTCHCRRPFASMH